ncbi:Os12g0161350, partial [Oryza sativa Japonica Group]
ENNSLLHTLDVEHYNGYINVYVLTLWIHYLVGPWLQESMQRTLFSPRNRRCPSCK